MKSYIGNHLKKMKALSLNFVEKDRAKSLPLRIYLPEGQPQKFHVGSYKYCRLKKNTDTPQSSPVPETYITCKQSSQQAQAASHQQPYSFTLVNPSANKRTNTSTTDKFD